MELAGDEGEGLLLTGRLSLQTHPWLADHAVAGIVLLPGTAFLELALRAADAGRRSRPSRSSTLQAPLLLPEGGAAAVQVSVSAAGEEGRRRISIHSRPEGEEGEWDLQRRAAASREQPAPPPRRWTAWPPEGAEPLEVEYLYDRLAEHGLRIRPGLPGPERGLAATAS